MITVVGGGLAGAATALRLARAGRDVTLFEREAAPALRVCGEFLGPDAVAEIAALDIDAARLGGVPITRLRLVAGHHAAECALPFAALALRRTVLDEALLTAAAAAGVHVHRGTPVRALELRREGVVARTDLGETTPGVVVLASGKHEVRGAGPRSAAARMMGLKLPLRLAPGIARDLGGCIELHLFRGGYAGLVGLGGGRANLCLAVDASAYLATGASLPAFVASLESAGERLAARLQGAETLAPRPVAVARIPYGYRCWRAGADAEGLWRVGDQAAVTPSFTGDGMAIALVSARLAATAIAAGEPRSAYARALAATVGRQMRIAGLFDALIGGGWGAGPLVRLAGLAPGVVAAVTRATRISAGLPRVAAE